MKISLPTPVVIGAIALVVLVVGFFFYRSAVAEPVTPRPDPAIFGAKKDANGNFTYPGQSGGGAVTPINPSGGK